MKNALLMFGVLGAIFLSGCEKDDSLEPVEKTLLKADKGILCRGCGQWDIVSPETNGTSTAQLATYDGATDTIARSRRPAMPVPALNAK